MCAADVCAHVIHRATSKTPSPLRPFHAALPFFTSSSSSSIEYYLQSSSFSSSSLNNTQPLPPLYYSLEHMLCALSLSFLLLYTYDESICIGTIRLKFSSLKVTKAPIQERIHPHSRHIITYRSFLV
jgi:hypothetical protein